MTNDAADSIDIERLSVQASALRHPCIEALEALPKRALTDIRSTVFTKIAAISDVTALAYAFQARCLMHSAWWQSENGVVSIPADATRSQIQTTVETYFIFVRGGFTHLIFSQVETTLRALLRAMSPLAANNATAEFKNVYECLLRTELNRAEGWTDALELLDFLRVIRNLIHNNGLYLNPKSRDTEITFRGKHYRFLPGTYVDFIPAPVVFEAVADVIGVLRDVIAHPRIANHDALIADPAVVFRQSVGE